MEASDIKLTTSAEDIYSLVREVKNLKARNVELSKDIDASHKAQDCLRAEFAAYKAAEAEREANIRRQNEREYERRVKVLELNERKVKAYTEYHNVMGSCLHHIHSILSQRITKADRAAIEKERERIFEAWAKFDAVQKQIADKLRKETWDPCKQKMPPNTKDSICAECAEKEGSKQ